MTQQDARILFILIVVCCVASVFAALFIALGCIRKSQRANKGERGGAREEKPAEGQKNPPSGNAHYARLLS